MRTVYVRKDKEDLFDGLAAKSEFVDGALEALRLLGPERFDKLIEDIKNKYDPPRGTPEDSPAL